MRRKLIGPLAAAAGLLCAAWPLSGQDGAPVPGSGPTYLYPGDMIELRVWREPELSGQFIIDERGTVVLPRIGQLEVGETPLDVLRQQLLAEYTRFLRNPSVEVVFTRRITVLGAVRNPGLYRIDPTYSVADVLALAGGPTPDGRSDVIHLVRDGVRLDRPITHVSRVGESGIRPGDQLIVPERRWIARNPAVAVSAMSGVISLLVVFLLR